MDTFSRGFLRNYFTPILVLLERRTENLISFARRIEDISVRFGVRCDIRKLHVDSRLIYRTCLMSNLFLVTKAYAHEEWHMKGSSEREVNV